MTKIFQEGQIVRHKISKKEWVIVQYGFWKKHQKVLCSRGNRNQYDECIKYYTFYENEFEEINHEKKV